MFEHAAWVLRQVGRLAPAMEFRDGAAVPLGGVAHVVRHDPADDSPDPLLAPTVMRGGPIRGWSDIDPEVALGDDELARLVRIGVGYVRGLPPKG